MNLNFVKSNLMPVQHPYINMEQKGGGSMQTNKGVSDWLFSKHVHSFIHVYVWLMIDQRKLLVTSVQLVQTASWESAQKAARFVTK